MDTPKKDRLIGTRIREYEILDVIGRGGMGAVYRARHIYLEEERAIKLIHSNLADDKRFIDRFIREAKILTKLHHPNLVQLYEFGTLDNDVFFMVLELLRGESVYHKMQRRGKLTIREAIQVVRNAALGLHHAHQNRIIHRDVSADNLFLARNESGFEITKVIDFGIARPHLEGAQPLTATDTFLGKLEYCSPEQCGLLKEGERIDHRTDIYSLGVTLYYMLAGRLPFYSPSVHGYIFKHITEMPQPVSEFVSVPDFPKQLDVVVLKTLAKKREDRQKDMQELAQELDEIAESMGPAGDALTIDQGIATAKLEFHAGELFANRYLIEAKLGEGGMGVVYRALDRMLDVRVALKVMGAQVVQSPLTLERLKREVILARKVSHSNACRIYDIGEYQNAHYVSMEYLEGTTLSDLMQRQGRVKPAIGIKIIKQVLAALHEAHRVGVIHRDLKPQNIMVDAKETAWIMDFGISTSTEVNKLTATGMLVGTPYYMAPEQLEGKDIDARADLYAVGVIMFQMFSGRLPFDAKTPVEVMAAHILSKFPKVSQFISGFPADLDDIVAKAMEKDPAARYQSAEELIRALDTINIESIAETDVIPISETPPVTRSKTVVTPVTQQPQMGTVLEPRAIPARFGPAYKWLAVSAFIILIAGLTVWIISKTPTADQKPVPTATTYPVVINALPWAHAKIKPLSEDIKISLPADEQITPCSILLPEGEYSVELTNNAMSETLVKRIVVKSGETNSFLFSMQNYNPKEISVQFFEVK